MTAAAPLTRASRERLTHLYDQIMWLAHQPHVTPANARAWYSAIMTEGLKRDLRTFTGMVSVAAAADPAQDLHLEHFMRMQQRITRLVTEHLDSKRSDPEEFIKVLVEHERVHIVTARENQKARTANGDYALAGIQLVAWDSVPEATRAALWRKKLVGQVRNAGDYRPVSD